MNEQYQNFLDKTPTTDVELAAQRIIIGSSKTQLLAFERTMRMIDKMLYSTHLKKISIIELFAALTLAKALIIDNDMENKENLH